MGVGLGFAQPFRVLPEKVVFYPEDEAREVAIRSLSPETLLLKIQWVERVMDSTGQLREIQQAPKDYCGVSGYIQIFPTRIHLPPGQSATFRLWKRVQPALPEFPECRSHLFIQAGPLPRPTLTMGDTSGKLQVHLHMIPGITLPVFIRAGKEKNIPGEMIPVEVRADSQLHLVLLRQGARSVSAKIQVVTRETTLVLRQGFYAPTRRFVLPLPLPNLKNADTLQILIEDLDTHVRASYRLPVRAP